MTDNPAHGVIFGVGITVIFVGATHDVDGPLPFVLGAIGFAITGMYFSIWVKAVEFRSEYDRRQKLEMEEYNRKLNSPEAIQQRQAAEEAKQRAAEELERQRLEREEKAARAKWVQFHRAVRLEEIDGFSGVEFERFVKTVLERRGFDDLRMTPTSGDQGGDLVGVSPERKKAVFQAKRWTGTVGNQAIQELLGALLYYEGEVGFVVTTSRFTDAAKDLAKKDQRIQLIDRAELARWVEDAFPTEIPEFDWDTYNAKVKNWFPGWSV